MNTRSRLPAFFCGFLLGCAFLVAALFGIHPLLRSLADDGLMGKFHRLRPEMTRDEVTVMMGSAGERLDEFRLPQKAGHEMEYYVAKRIGAAYFIYWHAFPAVGLIAAFDTRDRLIYKASGGT